MKRLLSGGIELDDDPRRVDAVEVHRYLSEESYWARGRPLATVEKLIETAARVGRGEQRFTGGGPNECPNVFGRIRGARACLGALPKAQQRLRLLFATLADGPAGLSF